jgi:membrane associated rhomboid family serine protease
LDQDRPHEEAERQPIFNAPAVVVVLLAALIAMHVVRNNLAPDTNLWWTIALAFVPARYMGLYADIPGGRLAAVTAFLSHTLVHGDWLHLFVNASWLLAFGSAVARRIGVARFLLLYAGAAIAGAVLYLAINVRAEGLAIMVGASGAISGLAGAAFRFLFNAMAVRDPQGLARAASDVPAMSIADMIRDRQARNAILAWVVLNFVLAAAGPIFGWASAIAWEAHLGGFLFGLLAFGLFDVRKIR